LAIGQQAGEVTETDEAAGAAQGIPVEESEDRDGCGGEDDEQHQEPHGRDDEQADIEVTAPGDRERPWVGRDGAGSNEHDADRSAIHVNGGLSFLKQL
jgi:hypothetical protein